MWAFYFAINYTYNNIGTNRILSKYYVDRSGEYDITVVDK